MLLVGISSMAGAHLAYAQQPWREAVQGSWKERPTAKNLPPFCGTNPKYKNHTLFTGPNYGGDMGYANHLCGALTSIPICRTYFGRERIECLNYFTEGYTYWISHAKNPNFALLPYLHTGLGGLYFEMGKKPDAISQFLLAIKKNPKYLKAYKGLIDAFIDLKQYDNAQLYLNKAMTIKPHKAFKRRQVKLNKLKSA